MRFSSVEQNTDTWECSRHFYSQPSSTSTFCCAFCASFTRSCLYSSLGSAVRIFQHFQSTNQSINQSTNQPTNQSINQSINQPINQSIDQKFPFFVLFSSSLDGVCYAKTQLSTMEHCTVVVRVPRARRTDVPVQFRSIRPQKLPPHHGGLPRLRGTRVPGAVTWCIPRCNSDITAPPLAFLPVFLKTFQFSFKNCV